MAIQLEGFDGPAWTKKRQELWLYGQRILRGQLRKGTVTQAMRQHGLPLTTTDVDQLERISRASDEDLHDLVSDTIQATIDAFGEKILLTGREGGWDPTLETTLDTYFVGDCYWKLLNGLRRRTRSKVREQRVLHLEERRLRMATGRPDPAVEVIARAEIETYVQVLGSEGFELVVLHSLDLTNAEIGDAVDLTDRQVEYRLGRAQERARNNRDRLRENDRGVA